MSRKDASPETLIDPVIRRARVEPEHTTLIFIAEDGQKTYVSAAEFHAESLAYARQLQNIGIGSDDLVILVLRHSRFLLSSFWGALYIGAIPSIFPYLTEKLNPEIYMRQVKMLVGNSGAKAVITFPEFEQDLRELLDEVNCRVLSTDDVEVIESSEDSEIVNLWQNPMADKIAFLQHSSGTTGLQKGVALSHRAVLNQVKSYSRSIELSADDVIVSWLPLYHDMGLIAGFVMPIVAGIPLVLMSPFHWIRDPKILLWTIHEHHGTLCWLPNFAYNHCVRTLRPRHLEGLDLSNWRAVINCSEPVRYDSHKMFLEKFSPFGFKEEALASCYAMAEYTFAVTQSPLGQAPFVDWVNLEALQAERKATPVAADDAAATPVVSCGYPIAGVQLAIVDDQGNKLPDRNVGEVILRGDCMLSGYYRRPDVTAEAIKEGWYYTGDMGYIAEGRLYITGRKKDLIIVGGKNIYPQDIEAITNEVPGVYPGRAVAFGVFDDKLGSETIIVVAELDDRSGEVDPRAIERELRKRVVQRTEVTLADVRLVDSRWLIKTSSGKIARGANRERYLKEFRGE